MCLLCFLRVYLDICSQSHRHKLHLIVFYLSQVRHNIFHTLGIRWRLHESLKN